ncbi:Peptidase M15A, partial [Reticulomyxa filosa]
QSGLNTLLSNNFAVKEFVSKDGSDGFRLAPELVQCLQTVRDTLKSAVYINSAYRTVTHNSAVGGANYSRHMSGTAVDAYSNAGLWNYANAVICKCRPIFQSNGQDIGLGLANTYIHADMRPSYDYWTYRGVSMTASEWNNYIMNQWSKCSTSSRIEITNQDVNEDKDHTDEDTEESVETDTIDDSAQSSNSSSSGNDSNNLNVIVPVVVAGALVVIIALIAYFIYRRIALNRKSAQQKEIDIPLTSYVQQDA